MIFGNPRDCTRGVPTGMDLYIQVQACGCSAEYACFCWGYSEHMETMTDTHTPKAEKASEMPIKHCSQGMCRSDSKFPQLVVWYKL